jgi:DNA-binding beta-propeller fold protein YncE
MFKVFSALLCVAIAFAVATPASAHDSGVVVRFATLPKPGPGWPEGIAADAGGRIYVSTFDFTTTNVIHIFEADGTLAATISLPGVVPLGLEFDNKGNLYVANFGGGTVLKFAPPFNSGSLPDETFTVCGGPPGCGLNALEFDARGNRLYASDSFGGRVFQINLANGSVRTLVSHDLLTAGNHGFPPFGANGLALDATGDNLYIANTADDRVLKFNMKSRTVTVFAESVNGADGLAFDASGRLWVAANQADEVIALNASGRVVARRGFFAGVGADGAPNELLFPASIVIRGGSIYVTNLALALTPAVGDEPEEDVTTYTVSRIALD